MKVSKKWLSEYVEIPCDDSMLVDRLTMAGIEVEGVIKASIPKGIIIAQILERNPHPNADKLSVCKVSTGTEELQIVCGASNCDAGNKIPLATIGTVFTDPASGKDFAIKKAKLRGVESSGMLCSEKELGLSNEGAGLLILPVDAPVGTPLENYISSDTIFELEITPNRPDLLSHIGIAREIAALSKSKLKSPDINSASLNVTSARFANFVDVMDSELCPRYSGRIIRNVKIGPSPSWLQERLKSVGLRPINNIVDITNFVLLELGHPLHAFDLSLLEGQKIIVRRAKDGEKIIALDGKEYKLKDSNLVICDAVKPVALAGIMGGEHSGVTEKTTAVLLESAYFKPSNIRASSRALGISTDSSYRFERGVDFEMVKTASDRATALIVELTGGELASELIDINAGGPQINPVNCRFDKIKSILGVQLSNEEMVSIFKNLGLSVRNINATGCEVIPVSYRLDIKSEADLAEEVLRIHGISEVPVNTVSAISGGLMKEDAFIPLEEIRNQFLSLGLNEVMNYSYADVKALLLDSRFSMDDLVKISNPISNETEFMRPSLFSGILKTVAHNISRKNNDLACFELGRAFCANSAIHPEERIECCIALTGRKHPERFSSDKSILYDFYDLKGLVESLLAFRKIKNCEFRRLEDGKASANFANGRCAELLIDGKSVAILGEASGRLTEGMRIQNPLYMAIIDIGKILDASDAKIMYSQLSPYPSTTRDIAMVVPDSLENKKILDFISGLKISNLESVEIFDEFRDKSLGGDRKSLAYTLTFRSQDRTLTDEEVNSSHEKVRKKLAEGLSVELR